MIDTDKYEGHTEGEWEWWNDYIRDTSENELHIAKMEYDYKSADAHLIADAPLLLAEVKQLRRVIHGVVVDLTVTNIGGPDSQGAAVKAALNTLSEVMYVD